MTMQHPARIELRAILRLAGPLIASQLAHMLMVLTDTLMMAKISPEALAGGGLGAATYSFVSIFCIGVIAAVGTLVSIRQGAGDIPGAARLTQAGLWLAWLMALVAGDLDALATRFTLKEALRVDGGWSLTLQPRDAALKQAFSRIVLDGDRYVRGVEIVEPAGDRTRIRFSGLREAPPATRQEAAQLD